MSDAVRALAYRRGISHEEAAEESRKHKEERALVVAAAKKIFKVLGEENLSVAQARAALGHAANMVDAFEGASKFRPGPFVG